MVSMIKDEIREIEPCEFKRPDKIAKGDIFIKGVGIDSKLSKCPVNINPQYIIEDIIITGFWIFKKTKIIIRKL